MPMQAERFPEREAQTVQQATLCFLIEGKRVLLAMKKRGFGEGLWNGSGGKVHEGEAIPVAVRREAFEEIGIHITEAEQVALLHFFFPDDPAKRDWNQDVHVFIVKNWLGDPKESEEMKPQWFDQGDIPLESMWADDKYWLPKVLSGEKVEGWFSFDDNNKVLDWEIKNVESGGKISS
jgi:8-oxo-dGTP pyrophosphatase MutT (NUDIX family)